MSYFLVILAPSRTLEVSFCPVRQQGEVGVGKSRWCGWVCRGSRPGAACEPGLRESDAQQPTADTRPMLTAADVATGGARALDYSPGRPARGDRQRLPATVPQPRGDTGSLAAEPAATAIQQRRSTKRRLGVGEHSFDAWPIGGPEHLVRRVTGNRQTQADALGRRDGSGSRLSLSG